MLCVIYALEQLSIVEIIIKPYYRPYAQLRREMAKFYVY